MSKLDHYLKLLREVKDREQEAFRILSEYKGKYETLRSMFPNDQLIQAYTDVSGLLLQEIEDRKKDNLAILELVFPLLSDQEKELKVLGSIVGDLISENKGLLGKFASIEEWKKRREKMLEEIENYVVDRKRFLDENK